MKRADKIYNETMKIFEDYVEKNYGRIGMPSSCYISDRPSNEQIEMWVEDFVEVFSKYKVIKETDFVKLDVREIIRNVINIVLDDRYYL